MRVRVAELSFNPNVYPGSVTMESEQQPHHNVRGSACLNLNDSLEKFLLSICHARLN